MHNIYVPCNIGEIVTIDTSSATDDATVTRIRQTAEGMAKRTDNG